MTKDSEWGEPLTGPEVKALGLPGDTPVSADDMPLRLRDWALLSDTPFYRLSADHPAYIVHRYNKEHGTNFVYWAGGDEAPDDWIGYGDKGRWPEDGNERTVLYRGHGAGHPTPVKGRWLHFDKRGSWITGPEGDIIGYAKKPQLVTEAASDPLQSAGQHHAPANHGPAADDKGETDTFIPCERTVHKLRAEVFAVLRAHEEVSEQCFAEVAMVTQALLPKPDRAEELANEWMNRAYWPDMGVDMAVVEYTRDLIERGEIKG